MSLTREEKAELLDSSKAERYDFFLILLLDAYTRGIDWAREMDSKKMKECAEKLCQEEYKDVFDQICEKLTE